MRVTWTSRYMLVPMSATHKGLLLRFDLSSNFPVEKKSSSVKCIGNQHETTRKDTLGNGNILSIIVLVKCPDCSLNPSFVLSFPCKTQQVHLYARHYLYFHVDLCNFIQKKTSNLISLFRIISCTSHNKVKILFISIS